MKITKVYTRTGDKGMTSLVGGVRIKKSDIRLEAYGTVDELSANLGMLVSMMKDNVYQFLLSVYLDYVVVIMERLQSRFVYLRLRMQPVFIELLVVQN